MKKINLTKKRLRFGKNNLLEETQEKISEKKERKDANRFLEGISLATDLGFAIAIPLTGGAVIGSYLDNKLNLTPKLTLSLIFFGVVISLGNIYQIIKRNIEK